MWKNLFLSVYSLSLLNLSKGTNITAFLGDNKVLQWTMNPLSPSGTFVAVLHPKIRNQGPPIGYTSLYSVLGTEIIPTTNSQAVRVTNTENTDTTTGNIEFTLNNITAEDGGDYRTRFTPPKQLPTTKIGIRLIVYVKPTKPTINVTTTPEEGKDIILKCDASSNSKPDDHGLQMKYKWYRNGADLPIGDRYVISGSQLQVKNIQRTDTNTMFTCSAFETESLVSNVGTEYTVYVQYGPDDIVITPSQGPYTVRENQKLYDITCTSSCNPACNYTWERNGTQVSRGQVLKAINNIKRGQAGQYVCKVTNIYGTKESSVTVIVQQESNMGAIIGGATAGGILIIVLLILLVVFLKRRRKKEKKPMNGSAFNANQEESDGMKPNILYESAGPRDKPDKNGIAQKETSVNAVYAEVVKPKNKKVTNDVYAEVVKSKGKGKTDGKKGKGKKSNPGQQNGDVYENAQKIDVTKERPSRRKNNQGLVYVDVEINGKNTNAKKTVIHGIQNKNEYADVDFTRHADPLPSDDEDDTT